jgi:hypothetical protein
MPTRANRKKGMCQLYMPINVATSTGVIAPARREPAWVVPWAMPRSPGSIQRDSARLEIGKAPASPMPIRNRQAISIGSEEAMPVRNVKTDHHTTTLAKAMRGPTRSPNQPPGIWNNA